jgi:hypothetical protein
MPQCCTTQVLSHWLYLEVMTKPRIRHTHIANFGQQRDLEMLKDAPSVTLSVKKKPRDMFMLNVYILVPVTRTW